MFLTASHLPRTWGPLSSVEDHVPLAAAAAPLIQNLHRARGISDGSLVYTRAVGTDVGENGTPNGPSSNVVGPALAKRAGAEDSWRTAVLGEFPLTRASLAAANLVLGT